jgi:16S rRNA (adenine1518-N6/adenine1519-N6)-dimethyltransferase
LVDQGALSEVADFANIEADIDVLEIGPGIGALTAELAIRTQRLKLIEIEERFCELLRASYPRITTICGNILTQQPEQMLSGATAVVSNVPYSISSELVFWILDARKYVRTASLLLQKEFAERLASEPGSRSYGALTVSRAYVADAELGPVITRDKFYPKPDVDSRLVRLAIEREPKIHVANEEHFFRIVRASFSSKRKTILNSLSGSGCCGTRQDTANLLSRAGIDPARRAETLSLSEFACLAEAACM